MVRSDLRSLRGIRIASDIVVAELNDDLPAFIRAMDDMVALQEPAVVLDALGKIAADLARDLVRGIPTPYYRNCLMYGSSEPLNATASA